MPSHSQCVVCQLRARSVGLVCARCARAIAQSGGLLPQQIVASTAADGEDALVDQWGRAHALAASTHIGRAVATNDIGITDASVSRHHARVTRTPGGWSVIDVGSSNGTRVNADEVVERALSHGDRIWFGGVGVYAVFDIGHVVRSPDPAVITSVGCLRATTQPEEPTAQVRIVEPTGGGGGLVESAGASAQLSATQIELVAILSRRMADEAHLPCSVRGYVRSSELIGGLSWDTRDPDTSHVKQLVRRVRRALIRSGLGDLIESRHRFGYRLRTVQ
jgi:hypothetical protein